MYYYDSDAAVITLFVWAVVTIIVACVMGVITKKINESKGYYGGFAWGFWLGIIGIIVVACRSDARRSDGSGSQYMSGGYGGERENPLAYSGSGWTCAFCGRGNPGYKNLCDCGRSKNESDQKRARAVAAEPTHGKTAREVQLEGAKKMLDDGLITNEEYEAKKNRILGIQKAEESGNQKNTTKTQLDEAKKLFDEGLITEEEYKAKRAKILGI